MDDLTLSDWLADKDTNTHSHTDYTKCYITLLGDRSAVPNNPCRPPGGHTVKTKAVANNSAACHLYMAPLIQRRSPRDQLCFPQSNNKVSFSHFPSYVLFGLLRSHEAAVPGS